MIVQFYKSQVMVGTALYPVPPGGASLNWPKNHAVPMLAGNYWQINYIEGLQTPSMDCSIYLLDGTTANCPIYSTTLNSHFMTRSNDYQHDVTAITGGVKFFDGFSGYSFAGAKANSFTISGSKGDDVRFSANYQMFDSTGTTLPTLLTSPPDGSYPYFRGQPIRFQSLSFQKGVNEAGKAAWDGVMSFSITFTNNMTPDLSMKGNGPQSVLPVDTNAGMMTASAQFTLQANSTQHIAQGDYIEIGVSQGLINTTFKLRSGVVETPNMRGVGGGRQTRTYSMVLVGLDNTQPPLSIA